MNFVNLSSGLSWLPELGPDIRFTRIQSTACEQKRWGPMILEAGYDLLFQLALGRPVCVFDCSRRDREPRALWQGIPWIEYAAHRTWKLNPGRIVIRGRHDVTDYFDQVYRDLPDQAIAPLRYIAGVVGSPAPQPILRYYRRHESVDIQRRLRRFLPWDESFPLELVA